MKITAKHGSLTLENKGMSVAKAETMELSRYEQRLREIRMMAAGEDYSRCTRRVIDFCIDFSLPEMLRQDAINIRKQYNLNQSSGDRNLRFDRNISLQLDLLRLIDEMEKQYAGEANGKSETKVNKGTGAIFHGKDIRKRFAGNDAFGLEMPNLDLLAGELTGVVGENGNGKTTLLRLVAGDLAVDSGELGYSWLESKFLDWPLIKQRIAYIPQRIPRWFGKLRDNLKYAATIHGIRGQENRDAVSLVISRLGLSRYEESAWDEISSGYKLRFELARALIWRPGLLVLDEPLANLDINTRSLFLQDLRDIASSEKYPVAVILSSQQLHELEDISDNIIFLENGKPVYSGAVGGIGLSRQENVYELKSPLDETAFRTLLGDLEDIRIETEGMNYVIRCHTDIGTNEILQLLLERQIEIKYFREISHSTRKLFRKEHA